MKKLMSGLLATTLAASFAFATLAPVNAAPVFVPRTQAAQSDVQTVQYQPWRRDRLGRPFERRVDRFDRRANARFYRRGDVRYYNGHRGYREYRRGYREYNGFWFPAAAFVAGALITGAINDGPRGGNSHVSWCYDRYRSYRASDNTFKPLNGPRRQCYSPYD
jgi:hypothetical protein